MSAEASAGVVASEAGGQSLEAWLSARVARFETRRYDWNVLGFQAEVDPKYKRAQVRYLGTGAAGAKSDSNTVPAEHFTFSTMVLPAGAEGPLHVHVDVEEVFFILKGKNVKLFFEYQGQTWETLLGERDLMSVPPHVYRGIVNGGGEEALICVMLGCGQPKLPTYPPDHPLAGVDRHK
jgi:mannose-6-phosphate isomerase-like protein (cupin superfamily)